MKSKINALTLLNASESPVGSIVLYFHPPRMNQPSCGLSITPNNKLLAISTSKIPIIKTPLLFNLYILLDYNYIIKFQLKY